MDGFLVRKRGDSFECEYEDGSKNWREVGPSSFGRIMFQIWKVAAGAQSESFTDSFQEEMQRRIPEVFGAALSVFSTLCDEHEA